MLCGTPVAPHIVVHPGIYFKTVKGDALSTYAELGQRRTYLAVKTVAVHAQVAGGIAQADQAGLDLHRLSPYVNCSNLLSDMAQFFADGQACPPIGLLLREG